MYRYTTNGEEPLTFFLLVYRIKMLGTVVASKTVWWKRVRLSVLYSFNFTKEQERWQSKLHSVSHISNFADIQKKKTVN